MAKVMTNLRVSQDKVQLLMARQSKNPYDLCSAARISYASYRRIMKQGSCKLATLGRLAEALGCDVTEIIEG
ncbi:MAG: helix-turn-helix domain-containing protein [Lachnospiraceae bacterium]|nr:helix-turn-helix domain-containing protein [Lachnospiraceae bacterium]